MITVSSYPNNTNLSNGYGFVTDNELQQNDYIDIKAIKAEKGLTQTLARFANGEWIINDSPVYEESLLRCQIAKWSDNRAPYPMVRQEAFKTSDTTPTTNETINWTYS